MAKLILIPGLGANRLLFEPQRHYFDQTLFLPDWQPPMWTEVEGKKPVPETLRDYARRWADRWMQTVLSRDEVRREYWIGGVSFGGQIALEATRRLIEEKAPPRGIFLIASNRTSDSITTGFKIRQKLGGLVPISYAPKLLSKLSDVFAKKERLRDIDAHLLRRIAKETDLAHLRWGGRACVEWSFSEADGKEIQRAGVNIHQIHGEKDWVIPLRRGHPDKVIPEGRHLINITHAEQVNQYIERAMKADMLDEQS